MGFIKAIRKQINDKKMLEERYDRLLKAVFSSAIKDDFVHEDLIYRSPDDFLKQLYALSEYYMFINPVLSSGLWGIWNSLNYMSLGRIKKMKNKELIRHYKALVATTVLQFSDGGANCYRSLDHVKKKKLKKYVAKSIKDLEKLPNWHDAFLNPNPTVQS